METIKSLSKTKISIFLSSVLLGFLFILPNFFGEIPVIQIHGLELEKIESLKEKFNAQITVNDHGDIQMAFHSVPEQLDCFQALKKLNTSAQINLNLKPNTPQIFQWLGLKPMRLGLDLRGGVHFVLNVHHQPVIDKQIQAFEDQIAAFMKKEAPSLKFTINNHHIKIESIDRNASENLMTKLNNSFPEYETLLQLDGQGLEMNLNSNYVALARLRILETTLLSMRNRINELGVAEASIYTQGTHQLVIDLPGIQDIKEAKQLIGKTATIDFYLVYPGKWSPGSPIPFGTLLKRNKMQQPYALLKKAVLSGDAIVFAQAGMTSEGSASVDLRITHQKAKEFRLVTAENIGKPMAVVYKETYSTERWNPQKQLFESAQEAKESIINIATIQSALGDRFQITGLDRDQSFKLALMLRAGSLPADISIIEEKTIGPSLGAENIKMGMYSLALGLAMICTFMVFYYHELGLVANLTLISNLSLLIMFLAMIQATLTMPGIAGIVLTLGMAVDANVLIFERIKEELSLGCSPWAALDRGFHKAADTIMDSNLTTMIIGLVLFFLGSGAIKGFAVTLALGLVTSMITALIGTKVFIYLRWSKELFPRITFFTFQNRSMT